MVETVEVVAVAVLVVLVAVVDDTVEVVLVDVIVVLVRDVVVVVAVPVVDVTVVVEQAPSYTKYTESGVLVAAERSRVSALLSLHTPVDGSRCSAAVLQIRKASLFGAPAVPPTLNQYVPLYIPSPR